MKLDLNCSAAYISSFLTESESNALFDELMSYPALTSPFTLRLANGERFQENYGKMMFIDRELFEEERLPEAIWGANQIWSERMRSLRDRVARHTGHNFQTCVCIYYPDGTSGVDYHSDPIAFGDTTVVASVSLGEERIFHLRENETQKVHEYLLEHGSLFIMGEHTQQRYEHALPLDPNYKKARINLTFRKYGFGD